MAANENTENPGEKKSGLIGALIVWLPILILSIGGGLATPYLVAQLTATPPDSGKIEIDPNEEAEYIDFPEVVAVLGGSQFNRLLKLQITLEVPKSLRVELDKRVTTKVAVLRNQVIAYVSGISEEEIAGTHGYNRLRREIQVIFNQTLYDDNVERIQDVHFREFQVQ